MGKFLFSLINPFLFGGLMKYKSIHAKDIANAMLHQIIGGNNSFNQLEYKELIKSSKKIKL